MSNKYALFSLFPRKIEIIQAEGIASNEIEIIENYALPFGTNWSAFLGARSIKVFPLYKKYVCIAYTVVASSEHGNPLLYCLASVHESLYFDQVISSGPDWIARIIGPLVEKVGDSDLKWIFRDALLIEPQFDVRVRICHWLGVQLHINILPTFHYQDAQNWTFQEEYARRLYLARKWQHRMLGFRPLSFTTLTLSKGEVTDVAIFALRASQF